MRALTQLTVGVASSEVVHLDVADRILRFTPQADVYSYVYWTAAVLFAVRARVVCLRMRMCMCVQRCVCVCVWFTCVWFMCAQVWRVVVGFVYQGGAVPRPGARRHCCGSAHRLTTTHPSHVLSIGEAAARAVLAS